MFGFVSKRRLAAALATTGIAVLAVASPVSAATGRGVVDGKVTFDAGKGVPVQGCGAVSGSFASTVLTGQFVGGGQSGTGTALASATFSDTNCESLQASNGTGSVDTVTITPGTVNVSCSASGTTAGTYVRTNGGRVDVSLSLSCTLNGVTATVTATVTALFVPTGVGGGQVTSASFAGAYTEVG